MGIEPDQPGGAHSELAVGITGDTPSSSDGRNPRGALLQEHLPTGGLAVSQTIPTDLLSSARPEWLEKLASGTNWLLMGVIAQAIGHFTLDHVSILELLSERVPPLWLALAIVVLVGYWKLTSPEPGASQGGSSPDTARLMARWTAALIFLAGLFRHTQSLPVARMSVITVGALEIINIFAVFSYAQRLAQRIPRPSLAFRARIVMWGWGILLSLGLVATVDAYAANESGIRLPYPTSTILLLVSAWVFLIGLAVFMVWSIVLFLVFRHCFQDAARKAQAACAETRPSASARQGRANIVALFIAMFVLGFFLSGFFLMPYLPPVPDRPVRVFEWEYWSDNWAGVLLGVLLGWRSVRSARRKGRGSVTPCSSSGA